MNEKQIAKKVAARFSKTAAKKLKKIRTLYDLETLRRKDPTAAGVWISIASENLGGSGRDFNSHMAFLESLASELEMEGEDGERLVVENVNDVIDIAEDKLRTASARTAKKTLKFTVEIALWNEEDAAYANRIKDTIKESVQEGLEEEMGGYYFDIKVR